MHKLFLRIAIRSCIIAIVRLILFHYHEYLPPTSWFSSTFDSSTSAENFKLFSTSAFSQLFSAYFFFSGVVFSNIMSQYRECESRVDDAVCTFHEFVDYVEVLFGYFDKENEKRSELIEPARNYLRAWVKVLDQPPQAPKLHQEQQSTASPKIQKTKSSQQQNRSPNFYLHQLLENARRIEEDQSNHQKEDSSSSSLFITKTCPLTNATLKCVEKFRQSSHRVWTIRRTQVLEPAQLYLNIMLVVVVACIFVVDWPSSPLIAEFVCVSGATACSMLIHSLILELDDPFDKHPRSILIFEKFFLSVWKIICFFIFLDFDGYSSTSVSLTAKRRVRRSKSSSLLQDDDETSGIRISVKPLLEAASSRM